MAWDGVRWAVTRSEKTETVLGFSGWVSHGGSRCHSGRENANDLHLDVQDGPEEGVALDLLPVVDMVEELLGVQVREELGDWVGGLNQSSVTHNN